MFWHAAQKEIRNVDTLISVVHTFLTSLDLFTQPFLGGQTDGESENAARREKQRRSDREGGERKKRGFGAKRTEGEGDLVNRGRKEREGLGTEERERETGGFPTSNEE